MTVERSTFDSLHEVIAAARSGAIIPGSTVEVADGHPELADEDHATTFVKALSEHHVHFRRSVNVVTGPIWIHPPEKQDKGS